MAPTVIRSVDVAANGTVTVAGLAAGQYGVRLTKVAINCAAADPHSRTVDVGSGATTGAIALGVVCGPVTQIAFAREAGPGERDIWVFPSDGRGATRLTTSPGLDTEPIW